MVRDPKLNARGRCGVCGHWTLYLKTTSPQLSHYFLRQLTITRIFVADLSLGNEWRCPSSAVDPLNGVWRKPQNHLGNICATVIRPHKYKEVRCTTRRESAPY